MRSWSTNPKSRRLMQIGQVCLIIGLLPRIFPDFTYGLRPNPLHFLCGFLLGISIITMLNALYIARRPGRAC